MVSSVDKLKGKKVVVVGGTSGIGHGAALALLEHGAHVTIISSSEQRVKSVVEDVGDDKLHGRVANVREEENFIEVLRSLAPIDHLVFSGVDKVRGTLREKRAPPGFIIRGPIAEANFDECRHLFGVKFWGSAICGKAAAKYVSIALLQPLASSHLCLPSAIAYCDLLWLGENGRCPLCLITPPKLSLTLSQDIISPGGSLTLTSGTGAMNPGKTASIGGALNAGLFTMTQGLALELADKRIRVNCVVPGIVATELWDKMGTIGSGDEQNQKLKAMGEKLPVGFCATGEDIAEAYLYAIRANYATGTLITIDGGGVLK
ncbi:hypothetical protein LTR17_003216 [Elasticomyces elasticus]|nr:hypothetical protein LTR17_003216 [Elasticomyces elasticus]